MAGSSSTTRMFARVHMGCFFPYQLNLSAIAFPALQTRSVDKGSRLLRRAMRRGCCSFALSLPIWRNNGFVTQRRFFLPSKQTELSGGANRQRLSLSRFLLLCGRALFLLLDQLPRTR